MLLPNLRLDHSLFHMHDGLYLGLSANCRAWWEQPVTPAAHSITAKTRAGNQAAAGQSSAG